jgi:AcrR family transcriptional regulator
MNSRRERTIAAACDRGSSLGCHATTGWSEGIAEAKPPNGSTQRLQTGYEAFTIEALAVQVHCSPATIYRHAGGKAAIRDAVVAIQATRIVDSARQAIRDLKGPERVVTATIVALQGLQSDPLANLMQSTHATPVSDWITSSPAVTGFAGEMLGLDNDDPLAAQWLIRVFLALWCWPLKDPATQRTMLQRFLGPPYRHDD